MNTLSSSTASTPDPVNFLRYLNGLSEQNNKAMESEDFEVRHAAKDVELAIQNTRVAREADLDKLIEEIDDISKKTLEGFGNIIQSNDKEAISKIGSDVGLYIDSLTYGARPKLNMAQKNIVAGSLGSDVSFIFDGVFPVSAKEGYGYEPTLTIGEKVYKVRENDNTATDTTIQFKLKAEEIIIEGSKQITVKLDLPWENGSILYDTRVATYNFSYDVLPTSPGKITAVYREKAVTIQNSESSVTAPWYAPKRVVELFKGEKVRPNRREELPQLNWGAVQSLQGLPGEELRKMVIETPDGEIIKLKGENSKHPYARVVTDEQGNHTLEITKA